MFYKNILQALILTTTLFLGVSGGRFRMLTPPGTSKEMREAMQYCGIMAEKAWKPRVDIRVKVTFERWIDAALATAGPTDWNEIDGVWYPVGIAKQLIGKDINKDKDGSKMYDMYTNINFASHKWYLGKERRPASDEYDIVSVCLHELFHGVHMNGWGYISIQDSMAIPLSYLHYKNGFDTFVTFETTNGHDCTLKTLLNDPRKLAKALTGGNLWFSTSKGRIARLNAPKQYSWGSSTYHLDSDYYGERNSLMKMQMDAGKAIHTPGPIILRILNTILDRSARPVPTCQSSVVPKT